MSIKQKRKHFENRKEDFTIASHKEKQMKNAKLFYFYKYQSTRVLQRV
jgi:hypothetical protein